MPGWFGQLASGGHEVVYYLTFIVAAGVAWNGWRGYKRDAKLQEIKTDTREVRIMVNGHLTHALEEIDRLHAELLEKERESP